MRRAQDQRIGMGQPAQHCQILHRKRGRDDPAGLVHGNRRAQMVGSVVVLPECGPQYRGGNRRRRGGQARQARQCGQQKQDCANQCGDRIAGQAEHRRGTELAE